jgi:hypothetical protein
VFFGVALLIVGGFLLGGAYSVWSGFGDPSRERTSGQVAVAGVLLIAALLASAAGVLWLV